MSTLALTVRDSATMVRRNVKHQLRYPSMTLMLVGMPLIFLLLFVFVFGGTLGAGLGAGGGRSEYLGYVIPGILAMTIAGTGNGTAVGVAMDMTEGIVARFRTMSIGRVSVLTGHVVGSMIQALIGCTIIIGVALLLGYRPAASFLGWLGVIGVVALIAFALIWLCVALGVVAKTVESASNSPMPLTLLPFLGSGFVPTDSMPVWLQWFAEYQPFTPMMETLRGLLNNTPVGNSLWLAIGWSLLIALIGYLWARKQYEAKSNR